jgi:hypothetical protein
MAERIIDGTQFNVSSIMYTSPKATPQGAKSINILNKATKTGLTLSTPLMLTWGASEFVDQASGQGDNKWTLGLQFPGDEYGNEETNKFLANIKALDDKIKADALIYSKDWLGKVYKSAEVVDALYTPMLKYTKNKATGEPDLTKSPTLRIKLPQWEGVWKFEIYDEDGGKLYPNSNSMSPIDYLKKGSNIMTLIQFAGIWFVNGKFSASWKLVQAVVQKPRATLQGQCFLKIKSEDKEKLKTQNIAEEVEDTTHIASTIVEDSDEEEEVAVKSEPKASTVFSVVEDSVASASVALEDLSISAAAVPKKRIVKKKDA